MELLELYRNMYKARAFETALAELWRQGLISGEMHLGTGEEAIAAGVAAHIERGDAVALDHRGTTVLGMLGVDMTAMIMEMLGREDGLCRGRGGHMHLFSPGHLAATSGIVGSSAPLAAGFGLAAKRLRPGRVSVAFFGEGACNQGMLLETLNLAACWALPTIFVCKDNGWAITTRSSSVTGGDLVDRAKAFGWTVADADGLDVAAVFDTAGRAVREVREGKGPWFLHLRCSRLDGHFLGDPLLRTAGRPLSEGRASLRKVASAVLSRGGGGAGERAAGIALIIKTIGLARKGRSGPANDPLARARKGLEKSGLDLSTTEAAIDRAVDEAVERALAA